MLAQKEANIDYRTGYISQVERDLTTGEVRYRKITPLAGVAFSLFYQEDGTKRLYGEIGGETILYMSSNIEDPKNWVLSGESDPEAAFSMIESELIRR